MQDVNSIMAENVGLIRKQLGKFKLSSDPEAESIAYEALYNAVCTYNGSTKFSTYATVCIYNALGTYVRTLNKKRQLEVISLHTVVYKDDDVTTELIDVIPSTDSVENVFVQADDSEIIRQAIAYVFDTLNDKQKLIVRVWQATDYTASTTDISKEVNISQSYVSQVLTTFRNRLKKKLKEEL